MSKGTPHRSYLQQQQQQQPPTRPHVLSTIQEAQSPQEQTQLSHPSSSRARRAGPSNASHLHQQEQQPYAFHDNATGEVEATIAQAPAQAGDAFVRASEYKPFAASHTRGAAPASTARMTTYKPLLGAVARQGTPLRQVQNAPAPQSAQQLSSYTHVNDSTGRAGPPTSAHRPFQPGASSSSHTPNAAAGRQRPATGRAAPGTGSRGPGVQAMAIPPMLQRTARSGQTSGHGSAAFRSNG